jgi:hypothetical protein
LASIKSFRLTNVPITDIIAKTPIKSSASWWNENLLGLGNKIDLTS